MASALKKFRMLEQQQQQQQDDDPATREPDPKPTKKNKLSMYSHIFSSFESSDTPDEIRRKTIEKVREEKRQAEIRKKEKLEDEKRRREEEIELKRRQKEEEERRQREEEEERMRQEEKRRMEEEEAERRRKEWEKKEGKYAGMKPAAAMFQRALDAKGSAQKALGGGEKRVSTLKKGTISEIRSKIFDQKSLDKSRSDEQIKPPPKKLIIPSSKEGEGKKANTPSPRPQTDKGCHAVAVTDDHNKPDKNPRKDATCVDSEKMEQNKPTEPKIDEGPNKRQSFISDFAALEKTYKILGISKGPDQSGAEENKKATAKKRHNSEGKIKNKDKVKAKRKSMVSSEVESNDPKEEPPNEPKVDKILKIQNEAKKNFFQEQINRNKGLVKDEKELLGPRVRKKGSLVNAFEQNLTESDKMKRQSQINDEVKVDASKFNSFLDKFESKDGREEAKAQMIKITNRQKEFEKQKKLKEKQRSEKEEELQRKQERELQAALQEEMLEQQRLEEEEEKARIRAVEEEEKMAKIKAVEEEFSKLEREEDEAAKKKKASKKKKKPKKNETEAADPGPKLNLMAGDVTNTRSMFERSKKDVEDNKEPPRPARVNKLTTNPFENMNTAEQSFEKVVTVKKLQRNPFMEQLEKKGHQTASQEPKKPAVKTAPVKKISNETCIKFESKKEKKPSEENQEEDQMDRKQVVRVSRSIEGPAPQNKSTKEKKSGSTLSLQKIFIDGPKEFFKSSKEKLYKMSKETLCEVNEPENKAAPQSGDKKPSRSEMQNYLLSHVLFDGKEVAKKEKPPPKQEEIEDIDDIENYLDDEYRAKIEQYCALLDDDKPKKKKKKKTGKAKKKEENLPTLKTVDIKAIQQQMQEQMKKPVEKKVEKDNDPVFSKNESHVNKFKGMFDNDTKEEGEAKPLGQKGRGKGGKSDILSKIKALENAEKERLEREQENEERIQYLLQKEIERQKENEIHKKEIEESSEEEAEEELKHNILQCLEDEVDNLEQEMRALDTQEQMIIEEEMEDLMSDEKEDANEADHKVQLQEIHEEIVERKKNAADKKRKVLERFQHVLDANDREGDKFAGKIIGKLESQSDLFNSKPDNQGRKGFEDSVFVGVSDVMSKAKDMFEAQEEKQLHLLSRDDIKRKANPTALKFEMMTNDEEQSVISPQPKKTDWSWKNKSSAELENELSGFHELENNQNNSPKNKPPRNFQDTKFSELQRDIDAVKQRLQERDLERENEKKIKEMEELIDDVKESLKQHEEQYFFEDETDEEYVEKPKKASKKKKKSEVNQSQKQNKLEDLKNQLLNKEATAEKSHGKDMTEVDVSVSQLRRKILEQSMDNDPSNEDVEQRSAKRSVSSNIITKLSEILPAEEKEDEVHLRKAPKMILKASTNEESEDAPAKTLEELKAEKEKKKWAWKEKNMADLQNFINENNSIAPQGIVNQQKSLKDLEDELQVVESIHGKKDAEIVIQIREEKEREFKEFMADVSSYLKEDTKTVQEEEFKEGMKTYLDLIDSNKKCDEGDKMPQIKLNSISRLKSSLLDAPQEVEREKKTNHKVQKLQTDKIEAAFQQAEKPSQLKEKIPTDQTLLVKKMFEEKSPNKSPLAEKKSVTKSTFAERFAKRAREEKLKRLEHQIQYKQKTINDLHTYIENNEILATQVLLSSVRESKIRKEGQRLEYHEKFMDGLNVFLKETHKNEEQNIFMGNIRAYLAILDNVESTYNATPKLRKHKGSSNQSNMRKAIIEKSVERPKPVEEEKQKKVEAKPVKKMMTAEEKRKEILQKYGFKDRSQMNVEAISDTEDDSTAGEVDVKELTDKELCEKYNLPYVPDSSDLYRGRSDSTSSFTGLLSKIRQASTEKSQTLSSTKKIFEPEKHDDSKEMIKSPTAKLRQRFDSECEETSRSGSPGPTYEPGSRMTDKIKRRFEEQRRSLVDDEVDAITSFAQKNSIMKSSSTAKMKKLFEGDSPTSTSRNSSPLLRPDRSSLVTSRMKKRFEADTPSSNRQSFIDDDSSADSRSCSPMVTSGSVMTSKIRSRFEGGMTSPVHDAKPAFSKGLQKSSTISDIGNALQNSIGHNAERQRVKTGLAENYFKSEKVTVKEGNVMSPAVQRMQAIEKSKSFSKFKNAFESGKGLNNDSSDDENIVDQKAGINAELEALRSSAKSSNDVTKAVVNETEMKKRELAASFFGADKAKNLGVRSQGPLKSTTVSDIGAYLRSAKMDASPPKQSPTVQTKPELQKNSTNDSKPVPSSVVARNVQQEVKTAPSSHVGVQHSRTASDIGAYLRSAGREDLPQSKKESPLVQRNPISAILQKEAEQPKVPQSPQLGLQHSKSFSKFKNAFEDGKGVMDEGSKPSQIVDQSQRKVEAEIAALKSSNKIQNMFRINKSKTSPLPSPRTERRRPSTADSDLDDETMVEVSKSRSSIASMFESQGPKMTFGGGERKTEVVVDPVKPKPAPKKKEDGPMNERKWVFDTIQKYFDVIVEEEKEEDEEDEDDEGEEDEDEYGNLGEEEEEEDNADESESDYTDAEDELPEINIPPPRERSGTLPTLTPFTSKSKPKELPRLNLPSIQRTSSLRASPLVARASTVSPATLPVRKQSLERKVSTVSIDECIDDAAKQFDQLTDGSDISLDRSPSFARGGIQKSSSSSRIRSMFSSVMQSNSNTSLNISMFKTNLQTHLSNSRAGSRVGSRAGSVAPQRFEQEDDSSSDFSEYD